MGSARLSTHQSETRKRPLNSTRNRGRRTDSVNEKGGAWSRQPAGRRLFRLEGKFVRDVHVPLALPIVVAVGIVAAALILRLTRRFDFFYDEWTYVLGVRNWSVGQYFVPHNEHWTTTLDLTYRGLIAVFGTRSYLPYMGVLMAWTIVLAICLFLVIRRRAGDLPALGASCVMLVLGRGWENLIWASQIGFVSASALGLLAVLLITADEVAPWRGWLGSLVLLVSLMSSGPGLFFVCWLIVELAFDRGRRRRLMFLVGPVLAYLVWFAVIGHTSVAEFQSPLSPRSLDQLGPYVGTGIGASASAVVGLSARWATMGALVLGLVIGSAWIRRRPGWMILGAAAGLVSQFVLVGAVRSNYGPADAGTARYVYVGAIFVLVMLADVAGGFKWRSPLAAVALAVVLVGAILNGLYIPVAVHFQYGAAIQPGQVSQQVAWTFRDSPGLDRATFVDTVWMPQAPVPAYLEARQVQGSPLPDLTPGELSRYPSSLVNRSLDNLLPPAIQVTQSAMSGTCRPAGAPGVSVPGGAVTYVHSDEAGPIQVFVWHYGPMPATPTQTVTLNSPAQSIAITPARAATGFAWHIAVTGPPASSLSLCPT